MQTTIKNYTQVLLYFVMMGGIIFLCITLDQVAKDFSDAQQKQVKSAQETQELIEKTVNQYKRLITFSIAKAAETNYTSRDKASIIMEQLIQDEADFGDENLAKIMDLFVDY